MSRGLGKMELAILATLQTARDHPVNYRGMTVGIVWSRRNGHTWKSDSEYDRDGWVTYLGKEYKIREDVFDLCSVSAFIASQKRLNAIDGPFQASFSRAVKSLLRKGLIRRLYEVPIIDLPNVRDESDKPGRNDLTFWCGSPRVRFVQGPRCYLDRHDRELKCY